MDGGGWERGCPVPEESGRGRLCVFGAQKRRRRIFTVEIIGRDGVF